MSKEYMYQRVKFLRVDGRLVVKVSTADIIQKPKGKKPVLNREAIGPYNTHSRTIYVEHNVKCNVYLLLLMFSYITYSLSIAYCTLQHARSFVIWVIFDKLKTICRFI